jgi:uncharacterized protein
MSYGKIKLYGKMQLTGNRDRGPHLSVLTHLSVLLVALMLLGCSAPAANSSAPNASSTATSSTATSSTATDNPLFIASRLPQPQQLPLSMTATINAQVFQLAVAQTPEQQQIGLMYRTSLADGEGMLFPFAPPRPVGFWMKNTLIPLDMLYIRQGVIQEIKASVPPCQKDPCPSYPSKGEIDQVIEIRGGLAKELGLKAGDRVVLTPLKSP